MSSQKMEKSLSSILEQYKNSFSDKSYNAENDDTDPLMDIFGVTPLLKRENRQYWGRELGMCWQRLVCDTLNSNCVDYKPGMKIGDDEPCDCCLGDEAIDTKYRIGSGDSGTLKKFKQYGKVFKDMDLTPVLLIVREDNLPSAITACKKGGWRIYSGQETFDYILIKSGFDLKKWMIRVAKSGEFRIVR